MRICVRSLRKDYNTLILEEVKLINLIIGHKGSGKTKKLIDLVNSAVETSHGNVVCIEKGDALTYNVNYRARLTSTDFYGISGYDSFYGFLSGICAGDHDITDVFIDATLKIGGRDYAALGEFLTKLNELASKTDKQFTFTVSADREELPQNIFEFSTVL